jgi:hypothetical protein
MAAAFRWNEWNVDHATRHGCPVREIESVIRGAKRPYPQSMGNNKWKVIGRGQGDRVVKAVYVIDPDGTMYPIHAMPLSTRRKRRRF